MTVEVWYGRWPKTDHEQIALAELCHVLSYQEERFLVLVQFHAGKSQEIDWVVIGKESIALVELKHARDKLVGDSEGDWKIVRSDGSEIPMKSNPVKQVKQAYWAFTEWCVQNSAELLQSGRRVVAPEFKKEIRSFIVIDPDVHPETQIEPPHPIMLVGLKKFTSILLTRSSGLNLSSEEMDHFPKLLKLTRSNIKFGDTDRPSQPAPVQDNVVSLVQTDSAETVKLGGEWHAPHFTGLVALGHGITTPLILLDLSKSPITIGRTKDNIICIDHKTISRRHARIQFSDGRYTIEDLGSNNGTFLNYKGEAGTQEKQVLPGMVFGIKNHSVLRFGDIQFVFLEQH